MKEEIYKRTLDAAAREISEINKPIASGKITVCTFVHNEMFFLPIFLEFYRALGVEQFIVLDDHSTDGSKEFLQKQEDVVLLRSQYKFGDIFSNDSGDFKIRIGTLWKAAIPRRFLKPGYILYVDVDEFLVLPDGFKIKDIFQLCESNNIQSVCASQVEMYPRFLNFDDSRPHPISFQELLSDSPYFDASPLFDVTTDGVVRVGESTSHRLFRTHNIRSSPNEQILADSSIYKTPIFLNAEDSFLVSSHDANSKPSVSIVLGLLHFKFSQNALDKVRVAIRRKGHNKSSAKYNAYCELFKCLRDDVDLRGPVSARFCDFNSLAMFGLARFN